MLRKIKEGIIETAERYMCETLSFWGFVIVIIAVILFGVEIIQVEIASRFVLIGLAVFVIDQLMIQPIWRIYQRRKNSKL